MDNKLENAAPVNPETSTEAVVDERKLILVVEDDNLLRTTVTRFLIKQGYDVQCVSNGFEALYLLKYLHPDLIISDIRMPKLDGLSMAEGLKNRDETKEIPLILVTAHREERLYHRAANVGACFYILKPFTLAELRSRVESALKRTGEKGHLEEGC